MKKFLSLFFASVFALSLSAQVYYLLPNSDDQNCEDVSNVYDNTRSENMLKWETYWNGSSDVVVCPERVAYEWFKDTYNGGVQKVVTYKDLTDGRLLSDGDLFDDVKVLWVNVDRYMTAGELDALFPSGVRTAIANYVKAGGNVYFSTFGVRVAYLIGRAPEPGFAENNGFCCDNNWKLTAHFRKGEDYDVDKRGHAIYKVLRDNGTHPEGDYTCFHMQKGVRSDRNCLWDMGGNMTAFYNFQNNNTCGILGSWGHTAEFLCAGLVEFYPTGDWKGTIITNGLAACSFAATNTDVFAVKELTKGILDYLSATNAGLAWNSETVPESGSIATTHIMTAHANAHYTITYSADDPTIANIGSGDGNIYFNYFGDATFHATATGDGWNVPKNATTIVSSAIPVDGGNQAVKFAYVLPYSLHVMANYENEDGLRPDFRAAEWFYLQFIAGEVGGQHGCFVRPSDIGSLNSAIKVLWIHNDHVGEASGTYYDNLGGDTFRDNLAAFVNAGGNVFVSKQATRLIGDLGRNDYPQYENGGYEDRPAWRIGNRFELKNGDEDVVIDHSTHAVYANMGTATGIMDAGSHTNNNDVWFNFEDDLGENNVQRLYHYQDDHNCRILGSWGHNALLENAGFVEYYPTATGRGTIIAMGLAAFHWANPTDNLKTLTRDVLYYLNIDAVPGFAWVTQPADGLAGSEQRIQIEDKATALRWTVSDSDIAELVADPEHPDDQNYKILRLKAPGEVTVTATRSADGYKIPKNVTGTTQVTKTITVTNAYTRDVTEGAYGTICLPKTAASYTGATMFRIADKTENGIEIEEVNAMEAGKPYIFQATASTINVTYGEGAPVAAGSDNGLIGYIGENNLELSANENHYIMANDQIWKVNVTVQVPSNRAYVDMNAINATPQAAPRRHISVKNTPTGVDELQETNGAVKQIKDGQLIIIRNEHMFNAQGQMIQ